jgi:RNA polymerase sigma-70 factor, ECF subfamily
VSAGRGEIRPVARDHAFDRVAVHAQLSRWPQLHCARADLLRRLGRDAEAVDDYRRALALEPPAGERAFIARRIEQMS